MLKRIIQACFLIVGGTLGIVLIPELFNVIQTDNFAFINNPYVSAILGAIIFYLITFWAIEYVVEFMKWLEETLIKAPITDIIFGSVGLLVGLLVAFMFGSALNAIQVPIVNTVAPILLTLLFGYLGFQVGFKKRDELLTLFRTNKKKDTDPEEVVEGASKLKILDTSVIIDGRIADICQTGFLEGTIVIPQFVLAELQHIADSSDALKRNRGRRGLDILNRIQKELSVKVEMYEGDFEEIQEVDAKLVKLAKVANGVVVTNDFNLNKVCEFQSVPVLNINDLANAVKPVVLPGEEMNVQVIKDGKEQNQGIAYLDDGTMIVVEGGRDFISKRIDVLVTSVLQTSAGRMIFAKPKILEKAL
ncbi:PIN/TRAM domain-containing protein [Peribacillus psychrosaccharolyticus]|uniref:PIN/TRAM domain-containing protein n=1 Tax=Peribacillus psychrosaccharolyticus TaxID=1407 RepID=A0A974RYS6_PERPY|nr:PIN/TRAM domain-containing protein [Peribacillus psychrosaccharolyticus]MEC2057920.1 PIN/TRAM domain-containing protein [Peribacillus psychrosaccharolyticus]MED3745796.1 PIN/TRAM domain-containing protein [Peribacillus psychrosaccharolyticus]QQS98796.1 PIN/TRAM domain-containing protein [Peribacillus psychrosaccharolyticus]